VFVTVLFLSSVLLCHVTYSISYETHSHVPRDSWPRDNMNVTLAQVVCICGICACDSHLSFLCLGMSRDIFCTSRDTCPETHDLETIWMSHQHMSSASVASVFVTVIFLSSVLVCHVTHLVCHVTHSHVPRDSWPRDNMSVTCHLHLWLSRSFFFPLSGYVPGHILYVTWHILYVTWHIHTCPESHALEIYAPVRCSMLQCVAAWHTPRVDCRAQRFTIFKKN